MPYRSGENYYDVLEVARNAPQYEIHRAYERAKKTYSADSPALYSMFTENEAKELIALVEEAYTVLGNLSARIEYDRCFFGESVVDKPSPPTSPRPQRIEPEKLPDGYAKTSISQYKMNPEMEQLIATAESFNGPFLRKIREYKNVDLVHLSELTRVGSHHIKAVENDQFDQLPATVFVRGFVVQIAKVLGLEHEMVANTYMDAVKRARS